MYAIRSYYDCKTYKRKEIEKRVTGIQTLTEGTVAPDFTFTDATGKTLNFLSYKTTAKYKLVIFWSADCEHCEALVNKLYQWHQDNKNKIDIFALSLDESDTEIPKWEIRHKQLTGWNHILTKGGINSPEAESYFILSTPTIVITSYSIHYTKLYEISIIYKDFAKTLTRVALPCDRY